VYDATLHVPTARLFGGHDAGVCGLMHAALTLCNSVVPSKR
jgi:hypothetical protein